MSVRAERPLVVTSRQLEVLRFIALSRRCPTLAEIQARFGHKSATAAYDHLKALERRGLLHKQGLQARALTITEAGYKALGFRPPTARAATLALEALDRDDKFECSRLLREMASFGEQVS